MEWKVEICPTPLLHLFTNWGHETSTFTDLYNTTTSWIQSVMHWRCMVCAAAGDKSMSTTPISVPTTKTRRWYVYFRFGTKVALLHRLYAYVVLKKKRRKWHRDARGADVTPTADQLLKTRLRSNLYYFNLPLDEIIQTCGSQSAPSS